MTNFADLVLGAHTAGLLKGKKALEETTKAGAATERATDGVKDGFKRAGDAAGAAAPKVREFGEASDRTKAIALAGTRALAGMAAAFGAVAGLGSAVGVIREFETSVSKMGAISGATTAELEEMRNVAKDLGSATEFSSKQAADGLSYLAMAGFGASESIAAIPSVLDLATASGMGLAQAADTASNIMSGFGISASSAASVTDVLAAASSRANTDVAQLGAAMSTVAPISAALDISLADTAAAVGVLSDAGIQGERAGTALRGILASLAGPTKQAEDALKGLGLRLRDVDPATNSLTEVMVKLGAAGLTTADAMTVFGREASSGALVLVEGAQRLGEFGQELRNVDGAAADMAATMRNNLGGDIDGLQSSISGLMLALGDAGLTGVLRFVAKGATAVARALTDIVSGTAAVVQSIASLVETATSKMASAADAANLAIADEIAQINALNIANGNAVVVSELAALNKLREAEAHLNSAKAKQEEARATLLNSEAYQSVIAQIDGAREALRAMRTEGNDLDQMPQHLRASFEETEKSLVAAYAHQKELLSLIPETSDEYEAAERAVEALRQRIGEATDGTVVLGGATADAADTTAALARLFGDDLTNSQKKATKAVFAQIPALKDLRQEYGASAEAMQSVLAAQNELAKADAAAGIGKTLKDAAGLADKLGLSAKQAEDFRSAMSKIQEMDTFGQQARAIAKMVDYVIEANGGVEGLDTETRKVIDSMLAAAEGAAEIGHQVEVSKASTTALGRAIAKIAPQFTPAINAANQLARAVAGVLAQMGSLAGGLMRLSAAGTAVASSAKGVAGLVGSLKTSALRAAAGGLGDVAKNLKSVWQRSGQAGATVADLRKHLKNLVSPGGGGGGGLGGVSKGAKEAARELREAEREAKRLQAALDRPLLTVIDGAANAFGDFFANGMRDAKGLGKAILNSIKSAISQSIAFAIANPIKVALGLTGGIAGGAIPGGLGGAASGGGLLGGLLGGVGSTIGGWVSGVASGVQGILTGGGLASSFANLGGLLSGSVGGAGAIGAALPAVGVVVAALSFFKKKTTLLDTGLRLTADAVESMVQEFDEIQTKRFWGLSKKVSKNYRDADAATADPILDVIGKIRSNVLGLGEVLGLAAENFASFNADIEISTKGISKEQAQERLGYALNDIADAMAGAALGWFDVNLIEGVRREGDSWMSALENLAAAISIANYSLDELGFAIFDASVAGAKAARDFADAFGGLEGFAKGISAYVDAFYSDGEKLEIITKRVREALAGIDPNNVNTAINSRGDFKALTDWAGSNAANDASQANLFAKLINAAPLIDQMFSLQEQIDAAANSAGGAGDSLEAVNAALQEREALEQRLLRLQGDTAALRQLEAAALDPSNRALLEQIHLLEDKAEADQIAAKIASERAGIERQILQLQGDTAKLREREVNALDASLRPLMQQVHALQDQAEATNAARLAAEALAAEQEAIANERAGLERTLMQLLGQTAELRNIEMAALHPSNRALKERIWAIEAEQEAAQALAAAEQERASERLALESRLLAAQGDVEAIRLRELNALHPANRAILAQIFSLEDATEARNAEALAAEREAQAIADLATRRADLERELLSLQGDKVALQAMELAALDPTLHALRKRIWALQEEQAATELSAQAARQIASERESLETRLLTLQGKTAELQVRAIAALDPSNRALQRHVFLLEAEAAALDEANRLAAAEADERIRLEVQLLELQGKTAELREREIAALFPANASIKQRIWALQEEAAALEEANRLAAAQADEKYRLETQLLELQGDTAALRSRELALLFPANHELKKRIWALQDAAAAEGGATDALNASTEKMRAALSLVEDLIGKAIDSISTAAQEQIDVLRNQLDAAQAAFDATSARFERSYDVVRASIDAERALTVAGYEAAIGSLDERIRSATAGIDGLSSVVGMLDGALAGRSAIDRAAEVRELAAAQSLLRGQGGRPPADQDQLRKALDVVGGDTARFYTRSEDYTREFLKNSIAIAKMRDNAAAQLSEGERTIAALEAQKEARAAQHDANMAALDRQAEQAEAIYQAALGNTVAIMDVDASISRLSQIAKQFTAEQVALQSLTATTNARIEAIEARADEQIDLLNDQLRAARTQVQIAEGTYAATLSITDAIDELNREVLLFLAAQESETPAAAAGTFGPETGALTASTSEGGPGPAIHLDTREMARELRQMREEFVRINQEMLKLTVQNKEYLKRISTLERINYQDRKKAEAEA